jgi:glycosyltransferase involved in cell wall biosynthesis
MDRLRNLKRRLGLDSVEFLGHVTEEEKWNLYAGCRYLVLPSLFESFGMVLLEAMAFGKPVIATSAGGIPEVVGNGGVVVSPGDEEELADAIMHVITTPELRSELSSKARERVRIFTWGHISLRLEKVYHECFVLARRRSMYDPSKLKEISIPTAAKDT